MEFRRKIYNRLLEWKKSRNGSTALLIEGARRVGKSYLVETFAKREYKSHVLIDFSLPRPATLAAIKNSAYDLDGLFNTISLEYATRLYPRNSLIVFDEVQLCPEARQLIKHLVADGRYDFVETGSLLTLRTQTEGILLPSEEERIQMNPMDFEEFRWALGDEVTVDFARERFAKRQGLGDLHSTVMARYSEYLCVGGMPQAVAEYVATKDISRADLIKRDILALYRDDIAKFAKSNAARVRSIFDMIPSQLAREEKRFQLSSISKSARMREYDDAFAWLVDARVVNPCCNVTDPAVGLSMTADAASMKIYMGDTGLLMTLALGGENATSGNLYKAVFTGDAYFNRGMIAENAVAQSLVMSGKTLYFHAKRNEQQHRNEIELDFLIKNGDMICPIEVKSGKYKSHSSLDKFIVKYGDRIGEPIILYTKDLMVKDGILHLPLYMSMFL